MVEMQNTKLDDCAVPKVCKGTTFVVLCDPDSSLAVKSFQMTMHLWFYKILRDLKWLMGREKKIKKITASWKRYENNALT